MNAKIRQMVLDAYKADLNHDHKKVYYGFIEPRQHGEFTFTVYAVSDTRTRGLRVIEVNRAWSDRPYYRCKNLWRNVWGQLMTEFDEQRNRPQESYGWYGGKWGGKTSWSKNGEDWFVSCVRYANLDALAQTKYKYCAFSQYRGGLALMPYIRLLQKHKEVEILTKSGLHQFVDDRFISRLKSDKAFFNFFRSHTQELLASSIPYTQNEVSRAYANGWTLSHARMAEYVRNKLSGMPDGIDRYALAKYLAANDIDVADYRHYVEDVKKAKEDILAFGVTFPRDFHAACERMYKRIRIAQAKADRERTAALRKLARRINALLERMHNRLAWRVGDYEVIVPTTREDFRREGNAMHNCIGGYFERCADGNAFCFFIRKDGERVADVEMSKSGVVRQCRGKRNESTTREVSDFAKIVAKKIASTLRRKAA